MVYTEFVNFIGGADGWPAHEGRQHVYSGKLLCLQGVVEGGMFGGRVQKDGGIRINIQLIIWYLHKKKIFLYKNPFFL